jgi:poly-beta-1,6-N-acetyl-D-glucosamine synthase
MIEWFIWVVSFISLYVGVFWLHIVYMKEEKVAENNFFPKVSIVVPARNEEGCLWKTLLSIVKLKYPKEKLQIIIANHSSTDNTAAVAKEFIKDYPSFDIILVNRAHEPGHIKAHSFNEGLLHATGDFVACVDADTIIQEDSLSRMIPFFQDGNVGAVISTIKVSNPRNIFEKIQHLEYLFATFARSLMSKIDTLHVTPGALSVYRKRFFDKYGPLDEDNITEDLEMAMRLRFHGHRVVLALKSVTFTKVPDSFFSLWNQRVRWFRGFIYNNLKYRGMLFSKKHGMMGSFQYPLNLISLSIILTMFAMVIFEFIIRAFKFVGKIRNIGLDQLSLELPTLKDFVLGMNVSLIFPILIGFLIAFFIYHLAHKTLKEKWKFPLALLTYLTVYPFLRSVHWATAVYKEASRSKKKW